jgi:hypothetical protein
MASLVTLCEKGNEGMQQGARAGISTACLMLLLDDDEHAHATYKR